MLLSSGPRLPGRGLLFNRAFLLLVLGSAIEGSSFVFGKSAVNELPVLFAHALRLLALSSTLIGTCAVTRCSKSYGSWAREVLRSAMSPSTSLSSPT